MNMLRKLSGALIAGLLTAGYAVADQTDEDPSKWEFGIGVGGQYLPDYRGSEDSQTVVVPFPVVMYNGDFLKADEDGVRGELLSDSRFELNLSADLSLASDADDNRLREGMPELLPTFEIGPDLIINLSGDDVRDGFAFHLPVRAVIATDLSDAEYAGWVFNPHLSYRQKAAIGQWDLVSRIGVLYGSERYHDYFYEVAPQFQTGERSAYSAESGYSGVILRVGLRRRIGNWLLGGSIRYDDLSQATFEDSSLVETDNYLSASFGVAWMFR